MKHNVLLIDDEHNRLAALKEFWTDVFKSAGLEVKITTSASFNIEPHVLAERPHFIIVDNVLAETVNGKRREVENRGIDFIAEHKPKHDDSVFILSTKATFSIDVLGHKVPNPDLIVPKTALPSKKYRATLAQLIRSRLRRAPFGRLNVVDPEDDIAIQPMSSELESIIEQCIHPLVGGNGDTAIKQVNLNRLGGGYSGALVFRVGLFDTDNRGKIPLVLKVSGGAGTSREVTAYNRFVRLTMPHDMRVDLLGYGEAGTYKGALYAFAFGDSSDLHPLAHHLREGEYDFLNRVVEKFFFVEGIGWYKGLKTGPSAEEFYGNSEEYSQEKDMKRLIQMKETASSLLGESEVDVGLESCRFGEYRFPFIRKQLELFDRTTVPLCVCHGDFNSNNIIFGRGGNAIATIDFEYSGIDLIYKDFVSLECSVRIDDVRTPITMVNDFRARVQAELSMLNGDPASAMVPYLGAVQVVRLAAQKCLASAGSEWDARLYALALSFHLLKVLGIRTLDRKSSLQLLAGFAACGIYLQGP